MLAVFRIIYLGISIWLALYGFNSFVLIFLYLKHRDDRARGAALTGFPAVTVQLPVYNEKYVIRRAIDSLAQLDWPRDKLQIQVLDDSTDETTAIARRRIAFYRRRGVDISLRRRAQRAGFKAGALNEAMPDARGEFVAIFDADFCPRRDFLRQTIPHLVAHAELGFVQTRWGHLNGDFSLLTQAQALALDGHHFIEHTARHRAGLLANFSGSGGVWRRSCIVACGGWQADTLTEDVDLSYRAQLAGWKGMMLPGVVSPAQLPVQFAAFKQQQFRWAKGNMQCLFKLAAPLVRAPIGWFPRLQALIHLSYYLAHPLMLIVMLCALPLIWFGWIDTWSLAFLSLATIGPPALYALAQRSIYPDWRRRLRALPVLVFLGTGMALNSTVAIIEAALGVETAFLRTPKLHIDAGAGVAGADRAYSPPADRLLWGEVLLAVYGVLVVVAALLKGNLQAIPFILLYVVGFGYTGVLAVVQRRRQKPTLPEAIKASSRAG